MLEVDVMPEPNYYFSRGCSKTGGIIILLHWRMKGSEKVRKLLWSILADP
jgi:hypothetical protein